MAPTNLSICICGHHQSEGLRRGPVYCSGQYGHCHVLELFQGGLRNEDSLDVVRCIRNLEQHYWLKDNKDDFFSHTIEPLLATHILP